MRWSGCGLLLFLSWAQGTCPAEAYIHDNRPWRTDSNLVIGCRHKRLENSYYRNAGIGSRKSYLKAEAQGGQPDISVEDRKRKIMFLRSSTGKGTQECYEALAKANGDVAAALAIINKGINEFVADQGGAKTQIIDLLHGRVATVMSPKLAVLLELRCETDFVSRSNLFISLTKSFANAMHDIVSGENVQLDSLDDDYLGKALMERRCIRCGKTAKDTTMMVKMALHERMIVTRLGIMKASEDEYLTTYLHGATVGTYPLNMVGSATSALRFKLSSASDEEKLQQKDLLENIEASDFTPENNCCIEGSECIYSQGFVKPASIAETEKGSTRNVKYFVRQIVQHIVGARPVAMSLEDYDAKKVKETREELEKEALASGKPKETVEKIVQGRLRKQFGEYVLLEQKWPFDGGKASVAGAIQDFEKKNKVKMELSQMLQFSVADDLLVYRPPEGTWYYNINLGF